MRTAVTLIVFLVAFLILHPLTLSAQSDPEPSVCEYQETRENVPINPDTNAPYKRNEEPFSEPSITKEKIGQCLQAKKPIKNHHIAFEDYRDAWKKLAEQIGDYTSPLLIQGGVLHANKPIDEENNTGGIRLREFRDPTVKDASQLTEEQRKALKLTEEKLKYFGIEINDKFITFIRSQISWKSVSIDSAVITFAEDARILKDIPLIIFSGGANFKESTFSGEANFIESTFSEKAIFSKADFERARFKDNADFRDMTVTGQLTFDGTTWEKRIDLRGISAKELHWDSAQNPSNVKGVFDFREAWIGSATFKEVRFQDLVDFSRTTFGQYKVEQGIVSELSPYVHFENNTFEKEADLLHVKFFSPAIFINNRFRSTLDLTGAMFEPQNPATSNSPDKQPRLCLSFNRINRLLLEPKSLGKPAGISPKSQWVSFRTAPLDSSRIREITDPDCALDKERKQTIAVAPEPLVNIYKTLGTSFREANDQGGINATFYLQQVAERDHQPSKWDWFPWLFLDLPSRYTVDVWRPVWISIGMMICFYFPYVWALRRVARSDNPDHNTLHVPRHGDRQRAFRIRLFEPMHRKDIQDTRRIIPWRDAAVLSIRAFTKIGLGTAYPNTKGLRVLTSIEWILGVYMLIHFILAVKNNLPFVLPFLGVVS